MSDPYVWPGTRVLRNRLGERDREKLDRLERLMTTARTDRPPRLRLTPAGYCALHRHLFEDLYDWAGEYRIVDIAKGDSPFCLARFIPTQMEKRLRQIVDDVALRSADVKRFSQAVAAHANELNAIHPFREGNGRVLRLFIKLVAARARHDFRITRIVGAEWMHASTAGFRKGDTRPMVEVIAGAIAARH